MADVKEMLAVIRELYPESADDGDGLAFGADERAFFVRPVGMGRMVLFSDVKYLEIGESDSQAVAELAFDLLEANDELLGEGPFSLALDPSRQFIHIQWLFDSVRDGEAALRAWLPRFVACTQEWIERLKEED